MRNTEAKTFHVKHSSNRWAMKYFKTGHMVVEVLANDGTEAGGQGVCDIFEAIRKGRREEGKEGGRERERGGEGGRERGGGREGVADRRGS